MRFRITVRGEHMELRGYIDAEHEGDLDLMDLAEAMKPFGLVIASVADENYNPFTDWGDR